MVESAIPAGALQRERRFFFGMSVAITATVIIGFLMSYLRMEKSPLTMPLQVHFHGAVFMAWTGLYLVQNWLVVNGSIALHRQLGMLGAALAVLMVALGLTVTVMCLQRGAVPFFFTPGTFLLLDGLTVAAFGGLVAGAIALREQADWHRRLMLGAMTVVFQPALGRLLPMPLLGPYGPIAVALAALLYVGAALLFDLRARRSVHPANRWVVAVHVVTAALITGLGNTQPVADLAARIAAG